MNIFISFQTQSELDENVLEELILWSRGRVQTHDRGEIVITFRSVENGVYTYRMKFYVSINSAERENIYGSCSWGNNEDTRSLLNYN